MSSNSIGKDQKVNELSGCCEALPSICGRLLGATERWRGTTDATNIGTCLHGYQHYWDYILLRRHGFFSLMSRTNLIY